MMGWKQRYVKAQSCFTPWKIFWELKQYRLWNQRPKDVRFPSSVKTLERENLAKGWAIWQAHVRFYTPHYWKICGQSNFIFNSSSIQFSVICFNFIFKNIKTVHLQVHTNTVCNSKSTKIGSYGQLDLQSFLFVVNFSTFYNFLVNFLVFLIEI